MEMKMSEDVNGSPSANCEHELFRLMKLVRETQCEMEVVKPVLDELEVMRLCRGFGMMSSVNPEDFNFDVLQAREFDGDFARFLRNELLENSCPKSVGFKGVFGKQDQVEAALVDMKMCSSEILESLDANNEGVYCVKVDAACTTTHVGGGEKVPGLVVFSWIREELFEPQAIRGTATVVLRFLTGLTPDIICCTSTQDLEQLKAAVTSSDEQDEEEFSSYSVSFRVERQVDQDDGTECVEVNSIHLDELPEDCASLHLLKGSYSALAWKGTMNSTVRRETLHRSFSWHAKETFAAWLKAESQKYRIELSGRIGNSRKLCECIFREFGMWPEDKINASREIHKQKVQDEYESAVARLEAEVARQRGNASQLSDSLFQLRTGATAVGGAPDSLLQEASKQYQEFLGWLQSAYSRKLDQKLALILDAPIRLKECEVMLYDMYTRGNDGELNKVIEMCATTTKKGLSQAIAQCRGRSAVKSSQVPAASEATKKPAAHWEAFLKVIAQPLVRLREKWWIAVESSLAAAKESQLKDTRTRRQKHSKSELGDHEKQVIENELNELRKVLLTNSGLMLAVSATARKKGVVCDISREILAPSTDYHDVAKVDIKSGAFEGVGGRTEYLGRVLLEPNVNYVAMFTVKVRSILQVCHGKERMCVKMIHFPSGGYARRPSPTSENVIRTFGKFASIADYNTRDRIMTFVSGESMSLYRFNESFKWMEPMKIIDLGVRSTLAALPFTDVLFMDNVVYVTDSSGYSQYVDIHNDQTSIVFRVNTDNESSNSPNRLMALADNLVVGTVSVEPSDDGTFEGVLECNSRDHRHLPILPLGVKFLSSQPNVQCVNDRVFVLDPLALKLYVFKIEVTVRSDSYRMRQVDGRVNNSENEASSADCMRKQHWLYAFYHVFEKFPVLGLLESGPPHPVSVLVACPGGENSNTVLEDCHDFLSLLMSDLMALNKPLHGLDLTKGLAVVHSLDGVGLQTKSLTSFLQTLITFLPIQVCRAEGNALTVLSDGMDQSMEKLEGDMETWGAADIAESIRFGLLSPLLSAWRGRCIVITSMGKQSTGKSYFLNHLTGSSFAIAGNRCTDGAWMTLRIMQDILLVVLDFEGLGSFERTDQEDVFLSVLNASLSMFTIFRMEMRFDKDTDCLFTKFQKGINLLKNDERLFQGSLYMSVKDVNPNDRDGVLSEFHGKVQKLVTANREQNFLTDMYSGALDINCSPPLGTFGYYESLRRARQLIGKLVKEQRESSHGFSSGDSFHDSIRLVLAKISILDWTAVDETSQRLQMNDLDRKLPGALRTGYLIPVDAQTKDWSVLQFVLEPLLHCEADLAKLRFDQISGEYPNFVDCWTSVNQEVSLDDWVDEDVDFGPALCGQGKVEMDAIHLTLLNLFQRYLVLFSKGALEKITQKDYQNFDAVLYFLVRRRKTKVALWLKNLLGLQRFTDEWKHIEQTHICSFEALLKRCLHKCAECQLQCMRSACHSFDEKHDCGMTHTCRSLCEYCLQNYKPGKDTPHCVMEAGHEGKCNCGKGDHTCGATCSLTNASNCAKLCVLIGGHDGDHRCSVKQHMCGIACSATRCGGKCILGAEHLHIVHKCAEIQCNHACEMESCKERCSTSNHFHDQPRLWTTFAAENGHVVDDGQSIRIQVTATGHVRHMCSSRHTCSETCEADGICNRAVEVSTCQFLGERDTFDFVHKKMVGVRNKCAIILKPGQTNHHGVSHSCAKLLPDGGETIHSCDVRCAACAYYCDKPFGHGGDHSAAHGSMRNMHFVAQDEELDWKDHKYVAGEEGIAEMCNLYCSSAGRGHIHYMKCEAKSASNCVYVGDLRDQRRHCKTTLKPNPGYKVDEVLHDKYWKTIGWEDPCGAASERALFGKCGAMCIAREHKGKAQSFCDLQAWHPRAAPKSSDDFSYIDGHRFTCSHASSTGSQHHVFVLDCSGSMRGLPWVMLVKGYREYLRTRLANGSTQDIVSVVTFGNRGVIEFERIRIDHAVTRDIPFRGGGTFYSNGLTHASAIISRVNFNLYKPVLIFFTDGRPADRKKGPAMATDIRKRYSVRGLQTFVVGCGRVSDLGVGDLADRLGGKVREAATAADLCTAFRSIAMSLGARAGLIHNGTA